MSMHEIKMQAKLVLGPVHCHNGIGPRAAEGLVPAMGWLVGWGGRAHDKAL